MYELGFLIAAPFLAILAEGIHRKLVARMQNRVGPPLLQPLYDLIKLWGKEPLVTGNDIFFVTVPILYFLVHFALFLFIPLSIISFEYDFIFLIYLTILGSAFYILSGVSSDSPYSIVSSMREMRLMICYEMALTIVFVTLFLTGPFSLAQWSLPLAAISFPLAAIVLFMVATVELHITPFDTAAAKTEILSAVETEYSGRRLFFMELGSYLKRLFYILLWPFLFVGTGNWILFAISVIIMIFLFAYSLVTTPRYRVDQAFNALFVVLVVALLEFVRVAWGFIWV